MKEGKREDKLVAAILILAALLIGTAILLLYGGKREPAPLWGAAGVQTSGAVSDGAATAQTSRSPENDGFILLPGGAFLPDDIAARLELNGIKRK